MREGETVAVRACLRVMAESAGRGGAQVVIRQIADRYAFMRGGPWWVEISLVKPEFLGLDPFLHTWSVRRSAGCLVGAEVVMGGVDERLALLAPRPPDCLSELQRCCTETR